MQVTRALLVVALAALAVCASARAPGILDEHAEQEVVSCFLKDQKDVADFVAVKEALHLDVWSHHIAAGANVDFRVTHDIRSMIALRFECEVLVHDVAAMLEEEEERSRLHLAKRGVNADWHDEYHPLAEIHSFIEDLALAYPDLATYVPTIGQSIEGRDIPVIRIKGVEEPPRTMFLSGCIHAREWVSPAVVQYLTEQLLVGYGNDNETTTILDTFEIVIAPCINPDGYNFSWTDDRLWRKNRRPASENGGTCAGVDMNRNFDNHWGGVGASANPCAADYRGASKASEPETQIVQNFVMTLKRRSAAIDFHAYGQLILRSFGYTVEPSENEATLKEIGDGMADRIAEVHGSRYTSQRAAELYPTTGSTDDWYTEQGGMWGWTIELRDLGRYGFRLPADQIRPTGEEIWAAFKYFAAEVAEKAPISN